MADIVDIKKLTEEQKKEIVQEALTRFKHSHDADREERKKIINDQLNVDGEGQWPDKVRRDREQNERVIVTVNKLRKKISRVKGEARLNKLSLHVVPHDNDADPETAEVYNGLFRTIENYSKAEDAYDWALECALTGARGWMRLTTEYVDERSFDQDLFIRPINDPLTVYSQPNRKDQIYLSDQEWLFVTEDVTDEDYTKKWPNAKKVSFEETDDEKKLWANPSGKTLRIAEYFRIVQGNKRTLYLFDDMSVGYEKIKGKTVKKQREVTTPEVQWFLISGADILETPTIWPGKHIPLVPVWGEAGIVKGERRHYSYPRDAIESQRLYNYERANFTEIVAEGQQEPYKVTEKMIQGYEADWNVIHKKRLKFIKYNIDPMAPNGGMPVKDQVSQFPSAVVEQLRFCDEEMNDTTGSSLAAEGRPSNEKSGRAVQERAKQSNIMGYEFTDNLRRGIQWLGTLAMEVIPVLYPPGRIARITNVDGTTKALTLGDEDEKGTVYDLWNGRYDVTVKVGPSYSSQREEAVEGMLRFMEVYRDAGALIGDLVMENLDWPGADVVAKRLKKMLPPGIDDENEQAAGKPPATDGMQEMETGGEAPPKGSQVAVSGEADIMKVRIAQERAKLVKIQLENRKIEMEIKAMGLMVRKDTEE